MECWGSEHLLYVAGSVLALLAYYPLATFVYPNLQFASKDTDIKYRPSWITLLQQMRLLLAAATVFAPANPLVAVGPSLVLFITAALVTYSMQPCLIWWINQLRVGLFLMLAWAALCAIALVGGCPRLACQVALGAGMLVLATLISAYLFRAYRVADIASPVKPSEVESVSDSSSLSIDDSTDRDPWDGGLAGLDSLRSNSGASEA